MYILAKVCLWQDLCGPGRQGLSCDAPYDERKKLEKKDF